MWFVLSTSSTVLSSPPRNAAIPPFLRAARPAIKKYHPQNVIILGILLRPFHTEVKRKRSKNKEQIKKEYFLLHLSFCSVYIGLKNLGGKGIPKFVLSMHFFGKIGCSPPSPMFKKSCIQHYQLRRMIHLGNFAGLLNCHKMGRMPILSDVRQR